MLNFFQAFWVYSFTKRFIQDLPCVGGGVEMKDEVGTEARQGSQGGGRQCDAPCGSFAEAFVSLEAACRTRVLWLQAHQISH